MGNKVCLSLPWGRKVDWLLKPCPCASTTTTTTIDCPCQCTQCSNRWQISPLLPWLGQSTWKMGPISWRLELDISWYIFLIHEVGESVGGGKEKPESESHCNSFPKMPYFRNTDEIYRKGSSHHLRRQFCSKLANYTKTPILLWVYMNIWEYMRHHWHDLLFN
jgi:hypothetical protein